MMKMYKQVLIAFWLAGSISALALEWSGTSRLAHQRWSERPEVGDPTAERQRESIRFRLMGSQQIGDDFSANVRFNFFTHEFRDRSPKPGHFDRVYIQWDYSENGMIASGLVGKMYKYVGDHLRSDAGYLPGFTWLHNWRMGDWNVFTGMSRFRMEDADNDTADPLYYLPQIGLEGKMGMIDFMVGTTYHLYSSVDMTDTSVNTEHIYSPPEGLSMPQLDPPHRQLAGLELFGQLMAEFHGVNIKAYLSMFSNGEAPEGQEDEANANLYGVELMFGKYMFGYAVQDSGRYSSNRAIGEDDWCGRDVKTDTHDMVKDYSALFSCYSSKLTLGYKWSDNLMPKLEIVSADRDDDFSALDGVRLPIRNEFPFHKPYKNFRMTRLSLNIRF